MRWRRRLLSFLQRFGWRHRRDLDEALVFADIHGQKFRVREVWMLERKLMSGEWVMIVAFDRREDAVRALSATR